MNNAGLGSPYWYEWEVGLLECLKMMRDVTIKSVVLQSSDFVSLDDVVVNYTDGSIINIQVKHTDCGENFTYSFLLSGETPMIKKWAKEWHENKNNYTIREIRIVTNRKWGPAESEGKCSFNNFVTKVFPILKTNYNYVSEDPSQNLAIKWFKAQIDFLGDEASEFVKILSFVQEGDLESVNLKISEKVASILGTDRKEALINSTNSLLAKLETWSTSKRERQEIFREDIYMDIIEDISINGYDCNAEQKIIATFSNPYDNRVDLLIKIGQVIDVINRHDFISNCVIEYIIRRRKYGYRGAGLNQLIKEFRSFFSNDDWMRLFDNIISSISALDMDAFYSINDDIETLCLYYTISVHPERLEELCSRKLDMHWNWLSACGLINQCPYELAIDSSIKTLNDFARFQLGSIKCDL